MNAAPGTHPSPRELAAFGLGHLDDESRARIEQHVAECSACCQRLRAVPDDTLLARLRSAVTPQDATLAMSEISDVPSSQAIPAELADHPRYRIVRFLGAGGMGVVFQAIHRLMERPVALKLLSRSLTSEQRAVERFRQEVKAAARLAHPNIVAAHDAEQAGDMHFLVMEYVDGVSLAKLVESQGRLPIAHACNFIRQAALGLQHAHERGMVHRDIKPHNLMVTRQGQVKILDFGLARLGRAASPSHDGPVTGQEHQSGSITAVGTMLGTPDYIAPEQIFDSRSADIRSDIYSLGGTFYFLLAGHAPFPQGTLTDKIVSQRESSAPPVRELRDDVPQEVADIVAKMLAKNPAERYQTPAEVAKALARWAKPASSKSRHAAAANRPQQAWQESVGNPKPLADLLEQVLPPISANTRSPLALRTTRSGALRRIPSSAWIGFLGLIVVLTCWMTYRTLNSASDKGPTDDTRAITERNASQQPPVPANSTARARVPHVLYVLPHDDFWYPDYEPVRRKLEEQGWRVSVASSSSGQATPWPDGGGKAVPVDMLLSQVNPTDFDAVVFAGGRQIEFQEQPEPAKVAERLIHGMLSEGRFVAGICRGSAVLATAGVLQDVSATGHSSVREVLENARAKYCDRSVVVSGHIITGRDWTSAAEFAAELVRQIGSDR